MTSIQAMADDFLAQKRIAVVGVSRTKKDAANLIYNRLKANGYQVFAVNPNAQMVEGDPCYPDVKSTPEKPDGVMIVTRPELSEKVVHDCAEAGISRVWLHCSFIVHGTSVSQEAIKFCEANHINIIPGGCPNMYGKTADFGHKCMRWMMQVTGRLPK